MLRKFGLNRGLIAYQKKFFQTLKFFSGLERSGDDFLRSEIAPHRIYRDTHGFYSSAATVST
jgi:hypothetical protein